jgi:hypothetical protein
MWAKQGDDQNRSGPKPQLTFQSESQHESHMSTKAYVQEHT